MFREYKKSFVREHETCGRSSKNRTYASGVRGRCAAITPYSNDFVIITHLFYNCNRITVHFKILICKRLKKTGECKNTAPVPFNFLIHISHTACAGHCGSRRFGNVGNQCFRRKQGCGNARRVFQCGTRDFGRI